MEQQRASSKSHGTTVNQRAVNFTDPVPDGRQILSAAGFDPADEHVLIQRMRHGTRSIGLDEPVDLREEGREAFDAFRGDRTYTFTIDERGYEWGAAIITEPQLRELAAVAPEDVLLLERQDEPDRELGPGDECELGRVRHRASAHRQEAHHGLSRRRREEDRARHLHDRTTHPTARGHGGLPAQRGAIRRASW